MTVMGSGVSASSIRQNAKMLPMVVAVVRVAGTSTRSTGSTSTTTQEEVFYETSRPLVPWGLVSAGVDYQPFRGPTIGVGAAVQNVPVYVGNTTATRHCVAIDGEQTCDGTLEIEPSEMAVVVSPWLDLGWFAGEHTSLNAQLWWHAYGPESLTRSVPLGARAALGFRW